MNGRGGADHPDERSAAQRITTLTQREREVLKRLAAGQTNQAMAGDLELTMRTVEIHRARMLDKLGVQSFAEAIRLAVLAGI